VFCGRKMGAGVCVCGGRVYEDKVVAVVLGGDGLFALQSVTL
jgi:hypothetical protein